VSAIGIRRASNRSWDALAAAEIDTGTGAVWAAREALTGITGLVLFALASARAGDIVCVSIVLIIQHRDVFAPPDHAHQTYH
jgi:hypothetical protein